MTQPSKEYYGNGSSGPSLSEQIKWAETVAEVEKLLRQGAGYADATPRTKNRWSRLAKARVRALEGRAS